MNKNSEGVHFTDVRSSPKNKKRASGSTLSLLTTEDSESPCKKCKKLVGGKDKGILCDRCDSWAHLQCTDLTRTDYEFLEKTRTNAFMWYCEKCHQDIKSGANQTDRLAEQGAKIETLTAIVTTLMQQNQLILQLLQDNKKVEEVVRIQIKESLEDKKEEEDRKNNLVVFNVEESDSRDGEKEHDIGELKAILQEVCPEENLDLEKRKIVRLGQRKPPSASNGNAKPKPRPIKIILDDGETRNRVLRQARRLKDSTKYKKIGLAADKTFKEREADKALRAELKRRKDQGEDVYISKGGLVVRGQEHKTEEGSPEERGSTVSTSQQ